jgi:tRNA(fMet)-specific endonuclease VapC
MKWMLDTNICIALIKQQQAHLIAALERRPIGEVGISSITLAELEFGVSKSARKQQNEAALAAFVAPLEVAVFDALAARAYGPVTSSLEKRGEPIGSLDTLIAGHALSLGAVLITNNTREFRKVIGLKLEDWTKT